jgi:hypothetical protein
MMELRGYSDTRKAQPRSKLRDEPRSPFKTYLAVAQSDNEAPQMISAHYGDPAGPFIVGDIITIRQIVVGLENSLNSTRGSVMQYQDLRADLDSSVRISIQVCPHTPRDITAA